MFRWYGRAVTVEPSNSSENANDDYEARWRAIEATIGKAVVMWSRAEFLIAMTFRAALESPPPLGAYLARRLSTAQLIEALKIAGKRYGGQELEAINSWLRKCSALNDERNSIFHGSYADQSDGVTWHPTIIWMNRKGEGEAPAHLDTRRFDSAAFEQFTAACSELFKLHAGLPKNLRDWINDTDKTVAEEESR